MTHADITKLSRDQLQELCSDLNYLNASEIKSLCRRFSIPFRIAVQTVDGRTTISKDEDRKGVILDRIRQFLETGVVPGATCFAAGVVCFEPMRRPLSASDRLYYGQYDKTNRAMNTLLQSLTAGQFKNGAVARILAREFWTSGHAPSFAEFAAGWTQAAKSQTNSHPEWAYLADRARRGNIQSWKQLRARKAAKVLMILDGVASGIESPSPAQ